MKTNLSFVCSLIVAALVLAPAFAQADGVVTAPSPTPADLREIKRNAEINAALTEFDTDSVSAMAKLPKKFDARTGLPVKPKSAFSAKQIADRTFVESKDKYRQNLCTTVGGARVCLGGILPGKAPFESNDLAKNLVDNGSKLEKNLAAMDEQKLKRAKLKTTPWSDTYWPIYMGQLAARYADRKFPSSEDWKSNFKYSERNDLASLFESGDYSSIDNLSPAEKYDLLIGDTRGSLTDSNWDAGAGFYSDTTPVEQWMGICHGWAPASYMVPRPKRSIKLLAADGRTRITFYPSDIKGLASLLWAKNTASTRFVGGRCNDKKPATDRFGRVKSQACFDTNPGTWHTAVVNQIGISNRSFVIDATYDFEVWNQPVYGYRYTYFNPQTRKASKSLRGATVDVATFTRDKFAGYRSEKAVQVVGIAMDLTYISETEPTHSKTDSSRKDSPTTVRYLYDLELDKDGEIIGGEWYENTHPDFLWTPSPGDQVETSGDRFAQGPWDGESALPESWRKAAIATAQSDGAPLSKIVNALAEKSNRAGSWTNWRPWRPE